MSAVNGHPRASSLFPTLRAPLVACILAVGAGVLFAGAASIAGAADAAPFLYVDRASSTCSEKGPGSEAQPFCSISAAAAVVAAGQTVLVHSGTYRETVKVPRSGTATAAIAFAPRPGAAVTVTGGSYGFYLLGLSYVTIDGFNVTATVGDGIVLKNSSRITIRANHVSYAGKPIDKQTSKGIRLENATDSLIVGNTVDHNSTYGIYLSTGSTRNEVSGNDVFANAQVFQRGASGIRVYGSPGNTISSNRSHDNEDSGIEFVSSSNANIAVNNVTYGNGDHGIDDLQSTGLRVISNTVYNNLTAGINVEGGSTGATIANNISVDNGIASPRTHGNIRVDSASTSGTTMDFDLVSLSTPDTMLIWSSTNYTSLVAFRAATGQEARGVEADPKWRDRTNGDFHLTTGSPAIDSANSGASGESGADVEATARVDEPTVANTGVGPRTYDDRGAYERAVRPVDHVVVRPTTATVAAGGSRVFTAEAVDATNDSLGDVTASATFTIAPEGSCSGATCGASTAGGHTVTATYAGKAGTAALNVTAGALDRIVLGPAAATITAGSSQAFTVEGRDQFGNSTGDVTTSATFAIAPNGSCLGAACGATAAGAHTVSASYSGKSATASLTVTAGDLDRIALTPASATITAGDSEPYTVTGRDQYGNATGDVTAAATLAIAPDGECAGSSCGALAAGSHTVTATYSEKTATATLTVVAGTTVDHIVVRPYSATIAAGGSKAYSAEGFDRGNNSVGDVTASTTFSIGPDGSCAGTTCGSSVAGPHTVTAAYEAKTATAALTVTPAPLDHIVVSPASATIAANGSQAYTAEGRDQYGNATADLTAFTTFTIGPNGSCVGASCGASASGAHTVTATSGGMTATAALTVTSAVLDRIELTPVSATLPAGASQAYTAEGRDQYGNSTGDVTGSTTFTIAPGGSCSANVCTAATGGAYTVTGTNAGKTATAALAVNFVRNPGFETDLSGWNTSGSGAGASLTRVVDTQSGSWVAKLANAGTTASTVILQDSPNWVPSTSGGMYTGVIWARADTAGATLKVRFREYSGATLVGTVLVEQTLTTAWKKVTITYMVAAPGSTLDFQAYVTNAASGTAFYADDVSILVAA